MQLEGLHYVSFPVIRQGRHGHRFGMSAIGPFHREIDVLNSHGAGVLVPGGDGGLPIVIESILFEFAGEIGVLPLCDGENNRGQLGIGQAAASLR